MMFLKDLFDILPPEFSVNDSGRLYHFDKDNLTKHDLYDINYLKDYQVDEIAARNQTIMIYL